MWLQQSKWLMGASEGGRASEAGLSDSDSLCIGPERMRNGQFWRLSRLSLCWAEPLCARSLRHSAHPWGCPHSPRLAVGIPGRCLMSLSAVSSLEGGCCLTTDHAAGPCPRWHPETPDLELGGKAGFLGNSSAPPSPSALGSDPPIIQGAFQRGSLP